MNYWYRGVFIAILVFGVNCGLMARPDVFFIDSASDYEGAYLEHELSNDFTQVKFVFSAIIPNVNLRSNTFFDINRLKNFISNFYQFTNLQLKAEMKQMLDQSMESGFKAADFLIELTAVLTAFINYNNV